jgi:glycosyltransferase involved in cell wall biosynthesis
MTVDLVFICYNRLDYTRKALASVLTDPTEGFQLTIWDNASTDGTREFLEKEVRDPRVVRMVFSRKNVGQVRAVNEIWSNSRADLVGKLDNDCIVTPGWTRTLAAAHEDIPELGVIGCWHFFKSDFDYNRARNKIQKFGNHSILRHPWTCGTGILVKRSTYRDFGPMKDSATTAYWLSMARSGYINGFYYPLIFQEHMDDPLSIHTHLTDEAGYQAAKAVTFNINRHGQHHLADRLRWRQKVLDNLLDGPWEPKYYLGWRARITSLKERFRIRNFFHLG